MLVQNEQQGKNILHRHDVTVQRAVEGICVFRPKQHGFRSFSGAAVTDDAAVSVFSLLYRFIVSKQFTRHHGNKHVVLFTHHEEHVTRLQSRTISKQRTQKSSSTAAAVRFTKHNTHISIPLN